MAKSKASRKGHKAGNNRGRIAQSVTPQGDTEFAAEPKSKLENAAKKKNTK